MQRIGWQGSALLMVMAACSADTGSHSDAVSGANGAAATRRTRLAGYENLVFGMTERTINDEERVLSAQRWDEDHRVELKLEKQAMIDGEDYLITLVVIEDKFVEVRLSRGSEIDAAQCKAVFERLLQSFEAQFGAADQRRYDPARELSIASFRFEGGGAVQVATLAQTFTLSSHCGQVVFYQARVSDEGL